MFGPFLKYFLKYIFFSRNRQRLLFLALVGLFISSFALLVLQGTMGGLQNKLMVRSKSVLGDSTIFFKSNRRSESDVASVSKILEGMGGKYFKEYEIELLARNSGYVAPVVVHGIEPGLDGKYPSFVEVAESENLRGIVMPMDLSRRLRVGTGENIKLISPVHINYLLGEVPRTVSENVGNIISTDVPEVDMLHVWTRLPLVQNLIRKSEINRIRIYTNGKSFNNKKLKKELQTFSGGDVFLRTWEDQNSTLVFALRLESTAMIFLFVAMTMLVSICITSALLIFFDKIRGDLTSFWILGMSKERIHRATFILLNLLGLAVVLLGLVVGGIALYLLDSYGPNIMPAVFVDRKIPIHITPVGVLISFFVPYIISITFSYFSLISFKNKLSYLDHVRSVGV